MEVEEAEICPDIAAQNMLTQSLLQSGDSLIFNNLSRFGYPLSVPCKLYDLF
jgi:hypothetical protein